MIFFSIMAVLYFSNFPRWVSIQYARFNLEAPRQLSRIDTPEASIYAYKVTAENALGEQVQLSSFKGQKVFVSLWASWCVPCIAEFSSLELLSEKMPELSLVLLNIEDRAVFDKFVKDSNYDLPFYLLKTPLPAAINARSIPATFILDEEGRVIFKQTGAVDWSSDAALFELKKILD